MNYYKARQRKSDGRWDFSCSNDDVIFPVGYCHEFAELDKDPIVGKTFSAERKRILYAHQSKYHTDGHATEEEACACYKSYLIDNSFQLYADTENLRKCQVCGAWTQSRVNIGFGVQQTFTLCPEHATPEKVATMFDIWEFWSS